ncbi:MAG: tRNA pseudouridine(55) synthase TruB [Rhodobacteraceae bacterium]|nr:tRNA pseudouridine(55) synthase TruB [Paracoccaceae bacterium]
MVHRKKGRPVNGWVIMDKPVGLTSAAVVNKVRRAFQAQKAGHAGTLDPAATGVLAVALGEATKTIQFVTAALKCYDFTIRFGQATGTDDAEGTVTDTSDVRPSDAEIIAALSTFTGDIMQIPPAFSAVKIDGQRAYRLARDGTAPKCAARPLYVDGLTLLSRPNADHARLELVCGKGGYVRAIARDLGRALGTCAHVLRLRRTWSGPFTAAAAVTCDRIEALAHTPELDTFLHPLEAGLTSLPRVIVSEVAAGRIRNGNPAEVVISNADFGETVLALCKGRPLAIGTCRAGRLVPSRVFTL